MATIRVTEGRSAIIGYCHNDNRQARPLLDALHHRFYGIEVDTYLIDGRLLVGHDLEQARASETLQALYLDPLMDLINDNGGSVYGDGSPVTLVIDVKSAAVETYLALHRVLAQYDRELKVYPEASGFERPIHVIISGATSLETMTAQAVRYAAMDGRIADLESGAPLDLMPMISNDWQQSFAWRGGGDIPAHEEQRLNQIVHASHKRGAQLRFFGAPDTFEIWSAMADAKVDLVSVDDLALFARYRDGGKE